MVSFLGSETEPSSGSSSPTTMRNSVVLPEPFGPTRPTFSPGFNWKEASTKTNCLPYCLLIFEKEIMGENGRNSKLAEGQNRGLAGALIAWHVRADQGFYLIPYAGIAFYLDVRRPEHLGIPGKA